MLTNQVEEGNQKGLENLILLVLGAKKDKISILHLEKEVFLLWNFHPSIKNYMHFIEHYKGPYAPEIPETIKEPLYLDNYWIYIPPKNKDSLSGGYAKLTPKGSVEYRKMLDKIKNLKDDDLLHLLNAITMLRQLYDKLSFQELLLLIYNAYPKYTKLSAEYYRINNNRFALAKSLKDKKIIDSDRYNSLIEG